MPATMLTARVNLCMISALLRIDGLCNLLLLQGFMLGGLILALRLTPSELGHGPQFQ